MNAEWIITVFLAVDDLMTEMGHRSPSQAKASDAEVLTVAIVAAKYFHNHPKLALSVG